MSVELNRLERIEALLTSLIEQKAAKDWYTTGEIAEIVGKAEYTIREWCRKNQIPARKMANGRGWIIANDVLKRIRDRELPIPEHLLRGTANGATRNT